MTNVAEIASAAKHISAEDLAIALQKTEMAVLKQNIETQALIQQQLANMIQEVLPHLGNSVNISA
jgi:hypothetical protein